MTIGMLSDETAAVRRDRRVMGDKSTTPLSSGTVPIFLSTDPT